MSVVIFKYSVHNTALLFALMVYFVFNILQKSYKSELIRDLIPILLIIIQEGTEQCAGVKLSWW